MKKLLLLSGLLFIQIGLFAAGNVMSEKRITLIDNQGQIAQLSFADAQVSEKLSSLFDGADVDEVADISYTLPANSLGVHKLVKIISEFSDVVQGASRTLTSAEKQELKSFLEQEFTESGVFNDKKFTQFFITINHLVIPELLTVAATIMAERIEQNEKAPQAAATQPERSYSSLFSLAPSAFIYGVQKYKERQ